MVTPLAPAVRVRDYRIERRLGGGGQAVTWLATDTRDGQRVVVKQLKLKTVETWKEIELFEREAATLRTLHHPAIPRFLDSFEESLGADAVDFFIIQSWVDAPSLAALIKAGRRFDLQSFIAITFQLLDILSWLHTRLPPVVHRDLKPSNILLDAHDTVHLIDFGAVKAQPTGPGEGESTIVGTHGYMPAEQLMGRASPVSDLYALGATLVHLASGRHPSTLPSDGLRLKIRGAVDLPPAILGWLETLLAPEPSQRPPSAKAAKAALTAALAGEPTRHEAARAQVAVAVRPRRRFSVMITLATLVFTGFILFRTLGPWLDFDPSAFVKAALPASEPTPARAPSAYLIPTDVVADVRVAIHSRRATLTGGDPELPTPRLHIALELQSASRDPITELPLLLIFQHGGTETQFQWDPLSSEHPPLMPGETRVVAVTLHSVPKDLSRLVVKTQHVIESNGPPSLDTAGPLAFEDPLGLSAQLAGAVSFAKIRRYSPTEGPQRGQVFEDISMRFNRSDGLRYLLIKPSCGRPDGGRSNALGADKVFELLVDDHLPGEEPWLRAGDVVAYRAICPAETTEIIWQISKTIFR